VELSSAVDIYNIEEIKLSKIKMVKKAEIVLTRVKYSHLMVSIARSIKASFMMQNLIFCDMKISSALREYF
jgi:hypothetical protein